MLLQRTPRALPRIGTAFGTALALLALSGEPALAAGSTLTGDGLHISTGALVDPAGRTWVADHNAGFCRMTEPTDTAPGQVEHPQHPGDPGARTCLGGLLPDAGTGPDAAGQPVFVDPTPDWVGNGDEVALIPDGASPSSEVVRAQWNPNTEKFEFRDTITMIADRGRPTVLSLGPDDAVYVGFQRETRIQRIVDPAAEVPQVEIVGNTSDGRAPQILAAGRDQAGEPAVYVAETGGLRMLHPDAGTVPTTDAAPFAVDPALAVGSMYYDLDSDFLYIGTANGVTEADAGIDTVMQADARTGFVDPIPYATGFSMVGGIGKAPNGFLYVLDDPALLDPAEPIGTGRLFHVGLPAAHVTAGPLDDQGNTGTDRHIADATPSFTIAGDGALECRLRGDGRDSDWQACGLDTGTFAVSEEHPLADGAYTLSVRATQGEVTGLAEHFRFTVDSTKPQRPVVVRPAADKPVSGSPWFEFFSDEEHVTYECSFDLAEQFAPCRPGRTASYDAAGDHTLQIIAIDRAGNRSDPSVAARFSVDPSLPPTPAPGWGEGPAKYKGSSLVAGGLHISTGAIVDPDGRTWVSDHNGGFCRVTPAGEDGAGTIDHPALPGDPGPRTCLGGLLPEAGTGPDAAGQPAYVDPTPTVSGNGDEVVLIPDGASPSSDVVRAQWNPDTGLFEFKDIVTMIGARVRPVAAATGPDGAVYVVFQRSGTVQRIASPAGVDPQVDIVGTVANGRRAEAVAAGRDAEGVTTVYVGEDTLITQLRPNAANPQIAEPSPFSLGAAGASIGAMAYDLKRDQLYAGTAAGTVAGADAVHRFTVETGAAELDWVTGYSMIGGLGLRPDGVLFVLDDPALLDPAEPLGTGRMFQVGLPAAHIAADSKEFVNIRRPAFRVTGEETVQCRLRGPGGLDTDYQACTSGQDWQAAQDLADGRYILTVRSVVFPTPEAPAEEQPVDAPAEEQPVDAPAEEQPVDAPAAEPAPAPQPEVIGVVESHRFTVDTVAPGQPRIASPANGATVGANPWFAFEAEEFATFACRWDGAETWTACEPGNTRRFTENGDHTLEIRASDRAGNVSIASTPVSFHARGKIDAVTITAGPEGPTGNNSPEFTFKSDALDVEFACRLNSRAFSSCTSPQSYANLADGNYTFEVQGMDAQGNISVARRQFQVDTRKPVIVAPGLDGATVGESLSLGLGISETGVTLTCTLDGAPLPCGTTISLSGLAPGVHTLVVTATDRAGNSGTLVRTFIVGGVVTPVTPAEPQEPSITVIDQGTGRALSVRLADIDRRVDLAKLQEAGVTVQVIPAQGTKLIRFRIFKLSGNGRNRGGRAVAASAGVRKTVVATIYRRVKPGRRTTIRLTRKELRKVTAGKYLLEVTPGASKKKLGKAKTAKFQVVR